MDGARGERLKGRLFGLLCEFEKGREWKKFLDSILTEMLGYNEEEKDSTYITLYAMISSLRYLRYEYFRATIFSCMDTISKAEDNAHE